MYVYVGRLFVFCFFFFLPTLWRNCMCVVVCMGCKEIDGPCSPFLLLFFVYTFMHFILFALLIFNRSTLALSSGVRPGQCIRMHSKSCTTIHPCMVQYTLKQKNKTKHFLKIVMQLCTCTCMYIIILPCS